MKNTIKNRLEKHAGLVEKLNIDAIESVAKMVIKCLKMGNKVLICGNGGSAADAQHIAAELVGKFSKRRDALPAVALNTNTSIITAIGNDFSFNAIFARQVEALGQKGDVLLAISTSGSSRNILEAIKSAGNKGMKVILLTGEKGKKLKNKINLILCVPSTNTPLIQEMHILIGHILCQMVDQEF